MRDICSLKDVILERDKDIRMRCHLFWMHLTVNGKEVCGEGRVGYEKDSGDAWTDDELDVIAEAFRQDAWFTGLKMATDIPDPTGN